VDGVVVVGVEGGAVGELHDSAQFVALRAGRDVGADEGFDEAGDLALQGADFGYNAGLLLGSDVGFPAEGEGMDDHEDSVISALRMDELKCDGGLRLCRESSRRW
jgi:hypothetical protein